MAEGHNSYIRTVLVMKSVRIKNLTTMTQLNSRVLPRTLSSHINEDNQRDIFLSAFQTTVTGREMWEESTLVLLLIRVRGEYSGIVIDMSVIDFIFFLSHGQRKTMFLQNRCLDKQECFAETWRQLLWSYNVNSFGHIVIETRKLFRKCLFLFFNYGEKEACFITS
jgi:hypothetical protein